MIFAHIYVHGHVSIHIQNTHTHTHTQSKQTKYIQLLWPILHEETCANVNARKSYGATGRLQAWCFYPLDIRYTRARVHTDIRTYRDIQTRAYIKSKMYRIRTDHLQHPLLGVVVTCVLLS